MRTGLCCVLVMPISHATTIDFGVVLRMLPSECAVMLSSMTCYNATCCARAVKKNPLLK